MQLINSVGYRTGNFVCTTIVKTLYYIILLSQGIQAGLMFFCNIITIQNVNLNLYWTLSSKTTKSCFLDDFIFINRDVYDVAAALIVFYYMFKWLLISKIGTNWSRYRFVIYRAIFEKLDNLSMIYQISQIFLSDSSVIYRRFFENRHG